MFNTHNFKQKTPTAEETFPGCPTALCSNGLYLDWLPKVEI